MCNESMTGKRKSRHQENEPVVSDWEPKATLPNWEIWLYIVGWVGAVGYCMFSVYKASVDYIEELNDYFLVVGWRFLGRRKDTSNFEWDFWTSWYAEIWPWLAGHLLLSHLCRRIVLWKRDAIITAYSQTILYIMLGGPAVGVMWGHVVTVYLATYSRSKVIVWITSLGLLSTLNMDKTVNFLKQVVEHDPFEKKFYLILFLLAMANLRYTSAALETTQSRIDQSRTMEDKNRNENSQTEDKKDSGKISKVAWRSEDIRGSRSGPHKHSDRHNHIYNLLDVAVYVFYPPLMFTGPVLTFDKFYKQFHHHHNAPTSLPSFSVIITFIKRCVRVAVWYLVLEFGLHFLYFNCLQLDINLMNKLPLWAVAGIGYCQGQFFMVKYVVLFGGPSILASIDGLETPAGPKCIARIYLYSDMWKYFDRGLYSFLKRYIYVPVGGSHSGLLRRLLASFLCFVFVYVWHGAEDYLLIWSTLNLIGIILETLAGHISQLPQVTDVQRQYLSASSSRRLHALLSVPLLAMSAIAIFYFFGGRQVGYCYFQRLILEGFPQSMILLSIFLYCCVQVSMETEAWEARKQHLD